MDDISKMSDHDLLITMHEQIKGVKADIKEIKDGTATKLNDHERRIRIIEDSNLKAIQDTKDNRRYMQWIAAAIAFMFGFLVWHVTGYHI